MFKRIKQMKDVVSETPDLLRNAQAMQANAQAASAMGAVAPPAPPAPSGADGGTGPIAGVDLATYAQVSRAVSDRAVGAANASVVAAEHGISAAAWDQAVEGWNARMQSDRVLAQQFNAMWRGGGR